MKYIWTEGNQCFIDSEHLLIIVLEGKNNKSKSFEAGKPESIMKTISLYLFIN